MGLIDYGVNLNRSGIDSCSEEFQSIQIQSEPSIVAMLRHEGILPEELLRWGNEFGRFQVLSQFDLLFLVLRSEGVTYLRTINYLAKFVTTVILDQTIPACIDLLRANRLVLIESHPPFADVIMDDRVIGEAPLWVWLRDGVYEIRCSLPEQFFKSVQFVVPKDFRMLCQRENRQVKGGMTQEDEVTMDEKVGSVLVYVLAGVTSLAAIILPFLLFF